MLLLSISVKHYTQLILMQRLAMRRTRGERERGATYLVPPEAVAPVFLLPFPRLPCPRRPASRPSARRVRDLGAADEVVVETRGPHGHHAVLLGFPLLEDLHDPLVAAAAGALGALGRLVFHLRLGTRGAGAVPLLLACY